jgi:glc operon protein GlcG
MKTGEYEKKIYNNEIAEEIAGISKPDFIGWEGGQPIILKDGTKFSIGFSGFTGVTDLEIVLKALEQIEKAC